MHTLMLAYRTVQTIYILISHIYMHTFVLAHRPPWCNLVQSGKELPLHLNILHNGLNDQMCWGSSFFWAGGGGDEGHCLSREVRTSLRQGGGADHIHASTVSPHLHMVTQLHSSVVQYATWVKVLFICDTKWPNRVGLWPCMIVLLTQCAHHTQQQGRFTGLCDSPAYTMCTQTEHHTGVQAYVAKTIAGMVGEWHRLQLMMLQKLLYVVSMHTLFTEQGHCEQLHSKGD